MKWGVRSFYLCTCMVGLGSTLVSPIDLLQLCYNYYIILVSAMLEYKYASYCVNYGDFCAVIGFGKRADRNKGTGFYRLPSMIAHQGKQTRQLSERRQHEWLSSIWRQDIKPDNNDHTRLCFISGSLALWTRVHTQIGYHQGVWSTMGRKRQLERGMLGLLRRMWKGDAMK